MQRPPLTRFYDYPVTAGIGILAIILTFGAMSRATTEPFAMSALAFEHEPWRLLTSALPHGGIGHLVFNVMWLWIFGTALEDTYGKLPTLACIIVLAAGSAMLEYAVMRGGIGLSGVGYGMFGMLLVIGRFEPRLRGVVTRQTALWFAGWFVFCIVATETGIMNVANVAHGGGWVLGMLLGLALAPTQRIRRIAGAVGLVTLLAGGFLGATVLRPVVNLASDGGNDSARLGFEALGAERTGEAILRLRRAVEISPDLAWAWYNLGVALQTEDEPASLAAFRRASAIEPDDAKYRSALADKLLVAAVQAQEKPELELAARLYEECLVVGGDKQEILVVLAGIYDQLARVTDAANARARASKLAAPAPGVPASP